MKRGQIRIIGGAWRGRRLQVADAKGLRPTPDRVRETLFNWLAPKIVGARCLDAFAGTGALGFEAASRGASHVVMTEAALPVWQVLSAHRAALQAQNVDIIRGAQPGVLSKITGLFDIVFLDPPWQDETMLKQTLTALVAQGKLAAGAWVYLEMPTRPEAADLPDGWHVLKQTRAGDVFAGLVGSE